MLYAIPVSGGVVCPHFGHCEQFALVRVDDESKKVTEKSFVDPPVHEPGVLPKWLSEQGVNVIIASGMGSRAQEMFRQNGVEVVVGSMEEDPEKAVLGHLEGNLQTGGYVCDH
jgi:ATP-binding protein involved in chromosome partitioning